MKHNGELKDARIHHPLGPVFDHRARVLILGSMPGTASLQAREYYAHPRNQFWELMGKLAGAGRNLAYPERLAVLVKNRIALWDVIASCEREGSLDASIKISSVTVNSLAGLIEACPDLKSIYFNGRAAEQYFRRYILKNHPEIYSTLNLIVLPSTSPAHASLAIAGKTTAWNRIKADLK